MNRTKIRTAIAALAALTTLSAIGVTGVASAARPITDNVSVAPVSGVAEMVNDGSFWRNIEGWKRRGFGGTATDGDCQEFADQIYEADGYRLIEENARDRNQALVDYYGQRMDELEDEALDAGCVILYT